ncbi:MAG: phenylalanine--tRNA ligase subunit alpha, partial [Candidatus Omnitrophica bacterium]|nr:phenylalanine--tRNA ligase subunit alpha [Candidatus Omnitrophota bacterium]
METEVKKLEEEFNRDLSVAKSSADIEALRIKYLGRKAEINRLFSMVPSLSKEEKGIWGRNLNILKNKISQTLEEKLKGVGAGEEKIDLTYPAREIQKGSRHILSAVSEEICSVFEKLGFTVVEGTEIEDEWHNFSALNIP